MVEIQLNLENLDIKKSCKRKNIEIIEIIIMTIKSVYIVTLIDLSYEVKLVRNTAMKCISDISRIVLDCL